MLTTTPAAARGLSLSLTPLLLRSISRSYIQGLTGTPEGCEQLIQRRDVVLKPLLQMLNESHASVSKAAATVLINLSSDPRARESMLDIGIIARIMTYIRELSCPHHDLLCMLLSNLTMCEQGTNSMLQVGQDDGKLEGYFVAILLRLFVDSNGQATDLYEHIAAVLCNITNMECGRRILLEKGRGLMHALTLQLQSKSDLRRRGCAGAIHNCIIAAELEGTLGTILEEKNNISRILDPLGVGGGLEREKDPFIRQNLAQCIQALAETSAGREMLMSLNAHETLREAYAQETDQEVNAAIEAAMDGLLKNKEMQSELQAFATGKMIMGD